MASFEVELVLDYEDNTQEKVKGHVFLKNPYDNDEVFDEITELLESLPSINKKDFKSIFASIFIDNEEMIYIKLEPSDGFEEDIQCRVIIPEKMTIH